MGFRVGRRCTSTVDASLGACRRHPAFLLSTQLSPFRAEIGLPDSRRFEPVDQLEADILIATVGVARFAAAARSIIYVPLAHYPTFGRAPVGFILDDESSKRLGIAGC